MRELTGDTRVTVQTSIDGLRSTHDLTGLEDFDAGRPTTTFNPVAASWFSLSQRPVSRAATLPIYAWTVRDLRSTCRVTVLADGAVGGFSCESQDVGRLSASAILQWITEQKAASSSAEDDVAAVLEASGHGIRWTATRDDTIIDCAFAHEGSTVSLSQPVHIPAPDREQVSRSSFIGEGTSTAGFIAVLILLVMAIGVLLRAGGGWSGLAGLRSSPLSSQCSSWPSQLTA